MSNLKSLFQFKEDRFLSFTHDVRVYIFGRDVSPWLKGSVNITYGNRDSFNTCSFELSNPHQIWQITPENYKGFKADKVDSDNVAGRFRMGGGEYSEAAKYAIFQWKTNKWLSPVYNLNVTSANYMEGIIAPEPTDETAPLPSDTIITRPDQDRKFRLYIGDCIFSKHDPIRVFVKNPLTVADEWMEVFCGYVQTHPVTTNYLTGVSTVRIDASCIRYMMTKMRVALNGRLTDCDPEPTNTEGIFKDFANPSNFAHPLSFRTLEEGMKLLILGSLIQETGDEIKAGGNKLIPTGLGNFTLGNVVCYPSDPQKAKQTAKAWHLMTMFGVHKKTFPTGGEDENLWLTGVEMNKIGGQTLPLPNLAIGGPDSRFLHFLLPEKGTGASTLVDSSIVEGTVPSVITWTTRWEVIREVASKLDFQVLTSPSGDLLIEFPQYGFKPDGYGELANILTFERHQKEVTVSDEAEDFPTVMTLTCGMSSQNAKPPEGTPEQVAKLVTYIYCPILAARYGMISEVHDIPYLGQNASDIGNSLSRRMGQLGLIEFTKRMANASAVDGTLVYRPFLFPNRPIYFKRSERIGLLQSVTHTWNVRQDAGTSVSCNMIMAKRPFDDKFRLITGSENVPIDYNAVWTTDDIVFSVVTAAVVTKEMKSGNPAAEGPTASKPHKGEVPASPMDYSKLDDLYPPFAAKVRRVIDAWNKIHPDDVLIISSGYRSAEKQQELRDDFEAGRGLPANEPWTSWHNYGLAIDLVPASCRALTGLQLKQSFAIGKYTELAQLAGTVGMDDPDRSPILWKKEEDPVHFELPKQWQNKVYSRQAAKVRVKQIESSGQAPAGSGHKALWKELDLKLAPLGFDINKPTIPSESFSPVGPVTRDVGTVSTGAECKDERLDVDDLTRDKKEPND